MCRVGHSFIKKQLRDENAVFAGELSGHYYFRENFYTDSGVIAMVIVLNLLSSEKKKMSELAAPLKKYSASGEINMEVKDKDAALENVKQHYKDKAKNIFELDGVSVEFEDWWFNLRKSNTEPVIRLNLEADTKKLMNEKKEDIFRIIKSG